MKVRVRIRELAEQQGLTAEQLAKKTGIPLPTIQRILDNGYVETITVSALARIGEVLGVPTRDLFVE